MSSFDETGISSGVLYFSASFEIAAVHFDVYAPTMPATSSRVDSFSNAAIAFAGLPVSSSLTRSTSIPCFLRSSIASVTPLERFSPIGASGPVMELMKPIFTFVAPGANAGTSSASVSRKTAVRFIAFVSLPLEVEELHLDGGLVLLAADCGFQLAEAELDVEVAQVRIPVDACDVALLAFRGVRRGEVALFVAGPRSELDGLEIEADVADEDVAPAAEGRHVGAAVEAHDGVVVVDRAEAERPVDEEVGRRSFVGSLPVPRRAEGDDLLRAEERSRVRRQVVDLGIEEVVLHAGDLPERRLRVRAQALEEAAAVFEVIVHRVAAEHEARVAAARAGQRGRGGVGVGVGVDHESRRAALERRAPGREVNQAGPEVEGLRIAELRDGVGGLEAGRALRGAVDRAAEAVVLGLEEEEDVLRHLAGGDEARAADPEVLDRAAGGVLREVGLRLEEDAELDVDVVVDADLRAGRRRRFRRRGGSGRWGLIGRGGRRRIGRRRARSRLVSENRERERGDDRKQQESLRSYSHRSS